MKDINQLPDETEMLLKQHFLNLDLTLPENEKIMNMIANKYLGNSFAFWNFKNINLTFFAKVLLPLSLVAISAIFYLVSNKPGKTPAFYNNITQTGKTDMMPAENKRPDENSITSIAYTPAKKTENPFNQFFLGDSLDAVHENHFLPIPESNKINTSPADTGDYFPLLTEEEIAVNNKRKKKMIESLAKLNKSKYALIPMGTVVYKNDTVSVQSFYMQTTEVSNIEYRTFLIDLVIENKKVEAKKAAPLQRMWVDKFNKMSHNEPMVEHYFTHPAYDNYPVVNISREGAEMYCKWMTQETNEYLRSKGKPFMNDLRLPYDGEWAVAATAGKERVKYANGSNSLKNNQGTYLQNYSCQTKDSSYYNEDMKLILPLKPNFTADGSFHTIGVNGTIFDSETKKLKTLYSPNNYGLHNVAGNVSEMVYVFDKHNKTSKAHGTKGGSWLSVDYYLEIDAEEEFPGETGPSPMIGFRPVMTVIKP